MEQNICDYSNYDYKKRFWSDGRRQYEHALEAFFVRHIIKKHALNKRAILDAGCGYGRLFDVYKTFFKQFYLVDYAQNLLDQAMKDIGNHDSIDYIRQSLYSLDLPNRSDVVLSIRTLHHLDDTRELFSRFNNALNDNGILILDIPNKLHMKNCIKYLFRLPILFSKAPLKLNDCFYNYHPQEVISDLALCGFSIIDQYQVGLFRIALIKKLIPIRLLVFVEKCINIFCSQINYAPSVYVVAKKCVDNSVDK